MPGQDCLCTPVGSNLQVNRLGRFVTRPPSLDLFRPTVVIGSSLFFFFFAAWRLLHTYVLRHLSSVILSLFFLFSMLLFPLFLDFSYLTTGRLLTLQLDDRVSFALFLFVARCTTTCPCASRIYSRAIILDDQERPRVRIWIAIDAIIRESKRESGGHRYKPDNTFFS